MTTTTMRAFGRPAILAMLMVAAAACSTDGTSGGGAGTTPTDAGTKDTAQADAGSDVSADSGDQTDVGPSDSTTTLDATPTDVAAKDDTATDDTATDDTASASDTAGATDSAVSVDAGGTTDSSVAADAGTTADAGVFKPGCCSTDSECGSGGRCVLGAGAKGQCKNTAELKKGECWDDDQCTGGQKCKSPSVCPCGASCLAPDKAGTCGPPAPNPCFVGGTKPGKKCNASEYCKLPNGCTGAGVCTIKPTSCIGLVDEHCGCDGQTHSNACVAASKGVNVKSKGACVVGPAPGCCDTDKDCKANQVCFAGPFKAFKCMATDTLKKGQCWTDAQCDKGSKCEKAQACGCKAKCKAADIPGTCSKPASSCAKVDPTSFGFCDMVLGVGWDGSKCVTVSGCGCKTECSKLFKTVKACTTACVKAP